jgi:hypothetical protein
MVQKSAQSRFRQRYDVVCGCSCTGFLIDTRNTSRSPPRAVKPAGILSAVICEADGCAPERRMQTITSSFNVSGSVKDAIEAIGMPTRKWT